MRNQLGLPEFVIDHVEEDNDERCLLYVVYKESKPLACPKCGCVGPFYKHTSEERIVQDVPSHGKLCYLKILTKRYKCRECGHTFAESFDCIDGKDRLTKRFRSYIQSRSLRDTASRIAQECNLSDTTINRVFQEYISEHENELKYVAPRVLGIDEDHVHKVFRFVITDIENKRLLDIIPDRDATSIVSLFSRMEQKQNVQVVTMDMYAPYKKIIKKTFPAAKIVVDHYHVIQLLNRRMDEVRKKARDKMNAEERKQFRYVSKLMKSNKENLSKQSYDRLKSVFVQYPQLGQAYHLKELIRRMYTKTSRIEAGELFAQFLRSVPDDLGPMLSVKATFTEWAEEIMNYFDWPYTNSYTENRNRFIKDLNSAAKGLKFEQLRYRVLFGSNATHYPTFKVKETAFHSSNYFGFVTFTPFQKELDTGFYIDLIGLKSYLSQFH